ncbi:hypothetical protein [Geosporobacter ferrireducens]|uniref:Uncharacterized protein n=1 Tax=Geosporobacter ferrireducens TaxID=1424294 RepID=A0A1D8GE45_9FIRM|nr:hypothetical protein [Geosporobacter ferrireducens]AOT69162.1 hypothetical protein Gferi_06050 [Geosporobacter ferrireducens]MTI56839.1 hypothetical protein [Geosporobacter ferrireducens]
MKKFLNGLLVVFLLVIIIGGIGYIGYSTLFMNHGGMNESLDNTSASNSTADNTPANQNQQNMQHGSMNNTPQTNNNQQTNSNQGVPEIVNITLQNKESLKKTISLLNESISYMTLDPYAPTSKTQENMGKMANNQSQTGNQAESNRGNEMPAETNAGGTTINIFPPGSAAANPADLQNQNNMMNNMGTTYDPNKMEQLHSGLYKLAVGMQLLTQLDNELSFQAEQASVNVQIPMQYYSTQYTLTLQNKSKLNQALGYINESGNLVNINPYVSENGLIYDKDRMQQIHQSVFKLAQGVGLLNKLNDDFMKQAVVMSNMAQQYANNNNSAAISHGSVPSGLLDGIFNNINASMIINIILIVFIAAFLFGILGFVFSLVKTSNIKTREDEA